MVSSSPAQGQRLAHAPGSVTIVWDQPVKPDNGGVTVLNSSGQNVGEGGTAHPAPDTLRADAATVVVQRRLRGQLHGDFGGRSRGEWGHRVPGRQRPAGVDRLAEPTADLGCHLVRPRRPVPHLSRRPGRPAVWRSSWLSCFRKGIERRRLGRWCAGAIGLGVLGMVVTVAAQGDLAGGGLGALVHWSVLSQAAGGSSAPSALLQLVGLAGCLASLRLRQQRLAQATAFYGMLLSAGAFVAFGHALVSPERWLSTPADVVHVVFAAMWLGGLIGLVQVLHSRVGGGASPRGVGRRLRCGSRPPRCRLGGGRTAEARLTVVLERPAAAGPCGDAANGSGAQRAGWHHHAWSSGSPPWPGFPSPWSSWREPCWPLPRSGSVANLFETGYGQTLLVKIALVGLLIVVAGYNRFLLVPWLSAAEARGRFGGPGRRLAAAAGHQSAWRQSSPLPFWLSPPYWPTGCPPTAPRPPSPVPFARTVPFDGGHLTFRITPEPGAGQQHLGAVHRARTAPRPKWRRASLCISICPLRTWVRSRPT